VIFHDDLLMLVNSRSRIQEILHHCVDVDRQADHCELITVDWWWGWSHLGRIHSADQRALPGQIYRPDSKRAPGPRIRSRQTERSASQSHLVLLSDRNECTPWAMIGSNLHGNCCLWYLKCWFASGPCF
jgi:hypothetical protein